MLQELSIFSSLNSLYYETGWDTFADRRTNKKLNLVYKIIHNDAPSYLSDLLPNRVNEAVSYDLRNHQNFQVHFRNYVCSTLHSVHQLSASGMV